MMIKTALLILTTSALLVGGQAVHADPARDKIIADLARAAGTTLSAQRGQAFFTGTHSGGKPDSPSCSTCHTKDMRKPGATRVGKPIDPMAVSVTRDRFTDPEKVAKWFKRNCNSVLGRECTATEQGDILTWLSSL
ncbi:MAG TPA: nitrate reductase [Rhodobacteraceae bacterium]|jgi:hypothetical protein|nr:DUF1924 domain-containing protein [Rhodobacter sp.]HBN32741.1 nitrate reductase [Paracoccaceae bacterium]